MGASQRLIDLYKLKVKLYSETDYVSNSSLWLDGRVPAPHKEKRDGISFWKEMESEMLQAELQELVGLYYSKRDLPFPADSENALHAWHDHCSKRFTRREVSSAVT